MHSLLRSWKIMHKKSTKKKCRPYIFLYLFSALLELQLRYFSEAAARDDKSRENAKDSLL